MKTIIMSAICGMLSFVAFGTTNTVEAVDVYSFKASIKQPMLVSGVRTYKAVALNGNLYFEYETVSNSMTAAYAIVENSKTKVIHRIDFTDGFYNLMGKASKTSVRSVPTVLLVGADTNCVAGTGKGAQEPHELIKYVSLAGSGTLKKLKTTTVECSFCGVGTATTTYCNKLATMSGNINGYMDCECPDDQNWNHTAETIFCGVKYDANGDIVSTHDASFYGTWTAKFVKTTVPND